MIANQVPVIIARMRAPLLVVSFRIPNSKSRVIMEYENIRGARKLVVTAHITSA